MVDFSILNSSLNRYLLVISIENVDQNAQYNEDLRCTPSECPTDSNRPYIPETYNEIERMKMGNVKSKGEKESGRHHRQCRDSKLPLVRH